MKEYYYFGHDTPVSAIDSWIFDEGDEGDNRAGRSKKIFHQDDLSIFFGGCGDCRHVIATLFDILDRVDVMNTTKVKNIRLELNDVHPFVFARFVVVCNLAMQLDKMSIGLELEYSEQQKPGFKLQGSLAQWSESKADMRRLAAALQSFAFDWSIRLCDWDEILKPTIDRIRSHFLSFLKTHQHTSTRKTNTGSQKNQKKQTMNRYPVLPLSEVQLDEILAKTMALFEYNTSTASAIVEAIDRWYSQHGAYKATEVLKILKGNDSHQLTPKMRELLLKKLQKTRSEKKQQYVASIRATGYRTFKEGLNNAVIQRLDQMSEEEGIDFLAEV